MSRLSRRVRAGAAAGVLATAATLAAVVPGGGAQAASPISSVPHANLRSTIQRLPNYFPGIVHWKLSTSTKHYGTTNWDTNTITISAFTPLNLLYSVVAHEWSHEIQAFDYHRDFWGIVQSMNRHFGGGGASGQRGVEYAADCMARELGATWTDYTSCRNKKWRHYAQRLLAGHMLRKHHRHGGSGSVSYTITPTTTVTTSKPKPKPTSTTTKPTPKPKPTPTTTSYPEPEPYPAPPAYTICWGPQWSC